MIGFYGSDFLYYHMPGSAGSLPGTGTSRTHEGLVEVKAFSINKEPD